MTRQQVNGIATTSYASRLHEERTETGEDARSSQRCDSQAASSPLPGTSNTRSRELTF